MLNAHFPKERTRPAFLKRPGAFLAIWQAQCQQRPHLEHGESRRVGGRPPDAQLLERFHQARLCKAPWRPCEVLQRFRTQQPHPVALLARQSRRFGRGIFDEPTCPST